jgi:hypothetical protein
MVIRIGAPAAEDRRLERALEGSVVLVRVARRRSTRALGLNPQRSQLITLLSDCASA